MSNKESDPENEDLDEIEISRRRFLKWSSYIPPAITGLIISSSPAHAATCNPDLCNPNTCGPDDPCGPDSCPPNF